MENLLEEIKKKFELRCKECGSDDVQGSYEPEHHYSEATVDSAKLSLGCNTCKKNDLFLYL